MMAKSNFAALALALCFAFSGCAPKEMFSWIDRNCFVADWTNHHSCLSCCHNGGCGQVYSNVEYPMLELGDKPPTEESLQSADEEAAETSLQ
jgi:hypothetical protein